MDMPLIFGLLVFFGLAGLSLARQPTIEEKRVCSVWMSLQNGEHRSLLFAKLESLSSPSLHLEGRYLQPVTSHIFILSKNKNVL